MDFLKRGFGFVVCAAVCVAAIWRQMQILAIAGLIGAIGVLFKGSAMRLVNVALQLLGSAKQAKMGSFEVSVREPFELSEAFDEHPRWVKILLQRLTPDQIGLLLQVARVEEYRIVDGVRDHLRALRARGLITHNAPAMTDSTVAGLTQLGHELVTQLIGTGTDRGVSS